MGFSPSSVRRSLSRLLVGSLLVPVLTLGLVAAGPVGAASAAVGYGDGVGVSFEFPNTIPGTGANCTGTAYYVIDGNASAMTQQVQVSGGDCDTGYMNNYAGYEISVTGSGTTGGGSSCSLSGSSTVDNSGNETFGLVTMTGAAGPLTESSLCVVTEVCMTASNPDASGATDCMPVNMGPLPVPSSADTCEVGYPISAKVEMDSFDPTANKFRYFYLTPTFANLDPTVTFRWSVIMEDAQGNNTYVRVMMGDLTAAQNGVKVASSAKEFMTYDLSRIAGVQFWVVSPDKAAGDPYAYSTGSATITRSAFWYTATSYQGVQGWRGKTDPGNCSFWVGRDVRTPAGLPDGAAPWTALDTDYVPPAPADPPAPVNPPADDTSACTFSLTDPTTWLEGGMCAAVGLLAAIWNTLKALVSAVAQIATAVLDGLERLFIPSASSWDLDGLVEQFEARAPFSFASTGWDTAQTMADTYSAGGSGCEGLPVFEFDHVPDAQLDCQGIKAVTGGAALYALAQIALVSLTGIAIVKMIVSAVSNQ